MPVLAPERKIVPCKTHQFEFWPDIKAPAIKTSRKSIPESALSWLDRSSDQQIVIPSSSTVALNPPGSTNGNVNGLQGILRHEIQDAVRKLHLADLRCGAGAIVTATCGGHQRSARPDEKEFLAGVRTKEELERLYFQLNLIAVHVAQQTRKLFGNKLIPILGSVLPSGDCYDGKNQLEGNEGTLIEQYRRDHRAQLVALAHGLVDAVLVEAGGVSVLELIAIVLECQLLSLPLIVSLAVGDDGRILDPKSNDSLYDLAKTFRRILGSHFLGLGLNCNSRAATRRALEQDSSDEVRLVYPNEDEETADQRAKGTHSHPTTRDEEIEFLRWVHENFPHVKGLGACCRDKRDPKLLTGVQEIIAPFKHRAKPLFLY